MLVGFKNVIFGGLKYHFLFLNELNTLQSKSVLDGIKNN